MINLNNYEDEDGNEEDDIYYALDNVLNIANDKGIPETMVILRAMKVNLPEGEDYIEIDGVFNFKLYSS